MDRENRQKSKTWTPLALCSPLNMAIIFLKELDSNQANHLLCSALDDPDPEERKKAVSCFEQLGDNIGVEPLIQALKDGNSTIRFMAAEALGKIGDDRAVDPLLQLLNREENEDVRKTVDDALKMIT